MDSGIRRNDGKKNCTRQSFCFPRHVSEAKLM